MSEAATEPDTVVGVNDSDESFAALEWALGEALLTGQSVSAVSDWMHSRDMGSEPDSDEAQAKACHDIANELRVWVDKTTAGVDFDSVNLKLTSVRASDTSILLQIGHDSQRIMVGRCSLSRMARWFTGFLSALLAEVAEVSVAVVRITGNEDETMTEAVASTLVPGNRPAHYMQPQSAVEEARRPAVVGVDGSEAPRRTFNFTSEKVRLHGAPLCVMFYWQLKDLGIIPGYENAMTPVKIGQHRAEKTLSELIAKARIPDGVKVSTNTFHIPVFKGLITTSRYASHLVVGSRGLSRPNTHFLGSVSRQIVNFAECTMTVMR